MKSRLLQHLALLGIVMAVTASCGKGAASIKTGAKDRGDDTHRIATCNIRVALAADEEAGNGWSARRDVCVEVLRSIEADIYCLQEVLEVQNEDLKRAFPDYMLLGSAGPEMDALPKDGGYYGIAKNPIMFSVARYELIAAGGYWLSDDPLTGGSMSWGSARARNLNWVRLRDRTTGAEFRVSSVHLDHISGEAREEQIALVLREAGQYPEYVPQILAGDFNSRPASGVAAAVREAGWVDTFRTANPDAELLNTTHKFDGNHGAKGPIDFIYYKGSDLSVASSQVVYDNIGGVYPSDHYFLWSDIIISR